MAQDNRGAAVLVPLSQIKPNPFQPRTTDDIEATTEIAANIYRNGLMQIPSARAVNGHYELVFGHTRKAAYELLASSGIPALDIPADPRFESMPLYLRDLDDRQMFEMALSENLKRRDLNPIEVAVSMKRYMQDFSASSREAGELFGVSDATVRGMVRLLKLPDAAQRLVATGEITQSVARQLVSLARIDEQAASKAATRIAEGGDNTNYVFQTALNGNKSVVSMHSRWDHTETAGGPGLWPLKLSAEKFPALAPISQTDIAKLLSITKEEVEGALSAGESVDPETREKVGVLSNPPACVACPFYLEMQREHFCGLKPCHRRKTIAWVQAEAAKVSRKLGIPIHDPEADGKDWAELSSNTWHSQFEIDDKMVKARNPGLRIAHNPRGTYKNPWTDNPRLRVIVIGDLAAKRKEQEAHRATDNGFKDQQLKWRAQQMMRDAVAKFMSEAVGPLFASAFSRLENVHVMAALIDRGRGGEKRSQPDELRAELALRALSQVLYGREAEGGPVRVAKYLEKVAATWGVDLPPDFRDIAKKYQPVSTETAAPKKAKRAPAEDEAGGDDDTD